MRSGWLEIPGVQSGERTLAEQMKGLNPALAVCDSKAVLDFGCAEGLIGIEFAKAGASVTGIELRSEFVDQARAAAERAGVAHRCTFHQYNLASFCSESLPADFPVRKAVDIVLALAIVHKVRNPRQALMHMAALARERLVIRLAAGSRGEIACKFDKRKACDSRIVMPECGFRLAVEAEGPRGELVQHWIR